MEFVPLLRAQRDLYDLPRGPERFAAYLRLMTDARTGDLVLPLGHLNPMAREHVPALLDAYLALDAEAVGARAVAEVAATLKPLLRPLRVALVLADDAHGGWTNRYTTDLQHRFENHAVLKRGWVVGLVWSSEPPTTAAVRTAVRESCYRAVWQQQAGRPRTLAQLLRQEGYALARSGTGPALPPDALRHTEQVLAPLRDATAAPTLLAALYGDAAAAALGYPPLGLAPNAGLALARFEAERAPEVGS